MMKTVFKTKRLSLFRKAVLALFTLLFALACISPAIFQNDRGRYAFTASAASYDNIKIQRYHTDVTVNKDRTVEIKEQITVEFLVRGLTMFYRSLPLEGARYENVTASCAGNEEFSYYVEENPDVDGFLDINCVGAAQKGNVWTYEISFVMENNQDSGNGMIIDVIPFGFMVPLHNVSGAVHFPAAITNNDYKAYVGYNSTQANPSSLNLALSDGGKTLTFSTPLLGVNYNDAFYEKVADGVTLDFTLPEGALDSYLSTRIFTDHLWLIILLGALVTAGAVVCLFFTRKKREIITTVNIKAPDNLSPLEMGKLLDGTIDSEDITSMLYYFANKGYLSIDLTDEDDPKLTCLVLELPKDAPAFEKSLFNGLFTTGATTSVSQLKYKYYEWIEKAKKQVPQVKMYEKKSVFGYLFGGILGVLYALLLPLIMSLKIGGGYAYPLGIAFAFPVLVVLLIGYLRENYRYKWKKSVRRVTGFIQIAVILGFSALFSALFARHLSTEWERILISIFAFAPTLVTLPALSRTEKYCETLGQILGFKEFIVVTEEDKIKFMLEENPALYYKILPYAQVLGVTDEWESKFENVLIEPPAWCEGTNMTFFDYLIFNRCLSRAFVVAMMPPQAKGNGSFVGRSGGGGSFGGFGGGGFGGGGGGAR